ncbi:MAG: Amuc_1100 family pilus-like protein [Opitutaceae bacterium]|jgi:hypothetical protein
MSFKKLNFFNLTLVVLGMLAAGEAWCIWERASAARSAEQKLVRVRAQIQAAADAAPSPSRETAAMIESDLKRAQRALATMQSELRGRGPGAARLAATKPPAMRTDAFFDLATFVSKSRAFAQKQGVLIGPGAANFGFSLYANEGPETSLIEPVFRQRLVANYIVDALLAARPRSLLAVQRERPLRADERKARNEALAAAAADPAATPPAPLESSTTLSPDYFDLDARLSAQAPGLVEVSGFRLIFTGQTSALRSLLNQLASFELPIIVRSVEVEPASGEDMAGAPSDEAALAPQPGAPAVSVVLSAPAAKAAKPVATIAPLVAKSISKFTVTLEYVELAPVTAVVAATP